MITETENLQAVLAQYEHVVVVYDEQVNLSPVAPVIARFPQLRLSVDETVKSLETVAKIYDFLISEHASRKTLLGAIGGGVLTDMAGFAAATYMRGIDWLAVPTTLLAMVDASTGGKTGVNFAGLKNYVGAFHLPVGVYIEPRFLETLPGEQLLSGYAELVKSWLLTPHLSSFNSQLSTFNLPEPDLVKESHILLAIQVKEYYVSQDPTEHGIRKALNFGHTVGHALEELSLASDGERMPKAGKGLSHGYAVLYGMVAELYLSHVLLGLDKQYVTLVSHLVTEYYGRPNVSCKQYQRIYELIQHDKKGSYTLLKAKGEPVIDQLASKELLFEALDYLFSI